MITLFNWLPKLMGLFTFSFGGDAPAPAPTQTTVQNTNIPEYAQPYVENMLNAAQAQIYNPSGTGFNPYVPYSTDPTKYVAGFSPLQMMAQSGTAGLAVPSQFGAATGQALGATGQLGMLAPQMGMAGINYARQATSPTATAAYMNPYLSASLDPMMAEARRQYDITGAQQRSAATGARALGGSREAIMAAENERNRNTALNQMLAQGYNQAFQQAQQAQQFGANLGLQGQQAQMAALQGQLGGAGQLGQLGAQQLAAQQGILGAQAQAGALQQQQQQQIINQAIQNYATAQQYPYMQLGTLNAMLRGLPMNQMTTQTYQAAPSMISQLGGLGSAALGAYGALNKGAKSGGLMEVEKFAPGGAIPIKHYSDDQLKKTLASPFSSPLADIAAQGEVQENAYTRANPLAATQIPQTPPQAIPNPLIMGQAPEIRAGLAAVGTNDMTQMAGGGLLAFAEGDVVPETETVPVDEDTFQLPKKGDKIDWEAAIAKQLQARPESKLAKQQREALEAGIKERDLNKLNFALMKGGFKAMQSTSPYALAGIGSGGEAFTEELQRVGAANEADRKELLKQAVESEKSEDARRAQLLGYGIQADIAREKAIENKNYRDRLEHDKELAREIRIQNSDIGVSNMYSDQQVEQLADHYRKTGELPANIRKGSILNSRIIQAAQKIQLDSGKSLDDMYTAQNQYQGTKKTTVATYKEFSGAGKSGRDLQNANTSMGHAEDAKMLVDAMQNNDTRLINEIGNRFSKEFGGTKVTNFEAIRPLLADEIAKGAIGGQTAQKDREGLAELIRSANSPQQLKEAIEHWQAFVGNKVASAHLSATSGGMTSDDFMKKLNPITLKYSQPYMTLSAAPTSNGPVVQNANDPTSNVPKVGTIVNGHQYLGGNLNDPKSWKAVDLVSQIPK